MLDRVELFAERLRLAAQAAAEARGHSAWTEELAQPVLVKLRHAWAVATSDAISTAEGPPAIEWITELLASSLGFECDWPIQTSADLLRGDLEMPVILSVLEAMHSTFDLDGIIDDGGGQAFLESEVNRIFAAHRIAFRMLSGKIIPVSSLELNDAVVEPVAYLLHGREDLRRGHAAYMKALEEIRRGDAADAVTDAGTALQETLEALGCDGNTLGRLIKSAKSRGLIGDRDTRLTEAIEDFLLWAASERNAGEAHHHTDSAVSDAWLMVHIVGALIVRLAEPTGRTRSQPPTV